MLFDIPSSLQNHQWLNNRTRTNCVRKYTITFTKLHGSIEVLCTVAFSVFPANFNEANESAEKRTTEPRNSGIKMSRRTVSIERFFSILLFPFYSVLLEIKQRPEAIKCLHISFKLSLYLKRIIVHFYRVSFFFAPF